jgi:LysM repeat protein
LERNRRFFLATLILSAMAGTGLAEAASLQPSRSGLLRQVSAARTHGFAYAQNDNDVIDMVRRDELVKLSGNRDYTVKWSVRHPYARPEVKLFVERLADQYRDACGERLVVTSLVRPKSRQPRNSSPLSVHPTGMALDLRVSEASRCRAWLERALVNMESRGVLEAARERRPPHYHVVLFPDPYLDYVAGKTSRAVVAEYRSPRDTAGSAAASTASASTSASTSGSYRVRSGGNMWSIARRHGTSAAALQRANGLRSASIRPGQVLAIPGAGGASTTATAASAGGSGEAARYRVRSGDSLWSIARRHGTSIAAIQRANGMRSATIKPGQVLAIPGAGSSGGSTVQTATYRVRRGDNLWRIAQRHGTTTSAIQRANGMRSASIKPGQVLTIPSSAR